MVATGARYCGKCGTRGADGASFCAKCGTWIGGEDGTPFTPIVAAPMRTITREYAHPYDRDQDIASMTHYGWTVQNIAHVAGSYNGQRGCVLAIIFLPLALLAGNTPDKFLVTFGTTLPAGEAKLPAQVRSGEQSVAYKRKTTNLVWLALVLGLVFLCVMISHSGGGS